MKKHAFLLSFCATALCSCADLDRVDYDFCPDDPDKVLAGVCGCGFADTDENGNGIFDCLEIEDACPDNPDKFSPGFCGCDVLDTDTDGDGIPDCVDKCPEDKGKVDVGVCGCGVPDDDADGDGVIDCLGDFDACPLDDEKKKPGVCGCGVPDNDTDGDNVLDCNDKCPDDPTKVVGGICGCGVEDSAENIADADNDGTSNCVDLCPNNPTKIEPGVGGCHVLDSDMDGMDDSVDACPYNPKIKDNVFDNPAMDCGDSSLIHITNARDLERLRGKHNSPVAGVTCDINFASACINDTIYVCDNNSTVVAKRCNLGCKQGKNVCEGGVGEAIISPMKIVLVDADINLADYVNTVQDADGRCHSEGWQAIPTLYRTRLMSYEKHKIQYEVANERCVLEDAIFENILDSEVSNLEIDVDLGGNARGGLANNAQSSVLSGISVKGTLRSNASLGIGGLVGTVTRKTTQDVTQGTQMQVIDCHGAMNEVIAPDATRVGGLIGNVAGTAYVTIPKETNKVKQVVGRQYVGGLVGYSTDAHYVNINNEVEKIKGSSSYVGGLVGRILPSGTNTTPAGNIVLISDIHNQVGSVEGTSYTAGFLGSVSLAAAIKNIHNEVKNISGTTYVGGLTGALLKAGDVQYILNQVENIKATATIVGGLSGSSEMTNFRYINNVVGEINGFTNKGGGLIGDLKVTTFTPGTAYSFDTINNNVSIVSGQGSAGGLVGVFTIPSTANATYTLSHIVSKADRVVGDSSVGGGIGALEGTYSAAGATRKVAWKNSTVQADVFKIASSATASAGGMIGTIKMNPASTTAETDPAWSMVDFTNIVDYTRSFSQTVSADGVASKETELLTGHMIGTMTTDALCTYKATNAYMFDPGKKYSALATANGTFTVMDTTTSETALKALQTSDKSWVSGSVKFADKAYDAVPVLNVTVL